MTIILMGVTGCGKTLIGGLLSERLGLPFFDGDSFHPPANIEKMSSGIPLNDEDRKPWLEALSNHLAEQENKGGCILACSALKKSYRDILDKKKKINVRFVYLKGTSELIGQRLTLRDNHYMPPRLLRSQFEALEEPDDAITVSVDPSPKTIVEEIAGKLHP